MKPFSTEKLWNTFDALTRATREWLPEEPAVGGGPLVDAAVRFTTQLGIDAAKCDHVWTRDLETALIVKLSEWIDAEGARVLRLWTHDMSCVIGALAVAAQHYADPRPGKDVVRYVMEIRPRNLAVAAVAFTIQLALEETELPAVALRDLESALIRTLEAPWEFDGEIPLSVEASAGTTWDHVGVFKLEVPE